MNAYDSYGGGGWVAVWGVVRYDVCAGKPRAGIHAQNHISNHKCVNVTHTHADRDLEYDTCTTVKQTNAHANAHAPPCGCTPAQKQSSVTCATRSNVFSLRQSVSIGLLTFRGAARTRWHTYPMQQSLLQRTSPSDGVYASARAQPIRSSRAHIGAVLLCFNRSTHQRRLYISHRA